MKKQKITNLRGTIFYWISDSLIEERDTLVFLPGLTANHTMFQGQLEFFKNNYNLLTWDTPAHGESRPYIDFSYSNIVEDLKTIFDVNNIKSPIIIGQSFGGYIAQSFIEKYPKLVKAFIGIDTTPYGKEYYSKFDQWMLRQIEWMAHLYPYEIMKKILAKQVSLTQNGYDNMISMIDIYSKDELCHLMGLGYSSFLENNKDIVITCPVLILLGDNDKTGKVKKYCEQWAKKTGFPLEIISNAAHNSNVDNPKEVNESIKRFIEKL